MYIKRYFFLLLYLFGIHFTIFAQPAPFKIHLESIKSPGLQGLQSYAVGQFEGKWLLVGGRKDGLHRRQPPVSFPYSENNKELIVMDPKSGKQWTAALSTLPSSIAEQLSASNFQFYQEGNLLYVVGGYGYSPTKEDHISYPYLSILQLDRIIPAIVQGKEPNAFIQQIYDEEFAVTGGALRKMGSVLYLLNGHRFDGRYNPRNGPSFVQTYTYAIRRFKVLASDAGYKVEIYPSITDTAQMRRRDLNAAAQIMPNGEEGLSIFSGVFREDIDLPHRSVIDITKAGYTVREDFTQFYNHYHCAVIPLYSKATNEMHTLFFGGIAQYFDDKGVLTQENNVPFVRTVARITRNARNEMREYKLPILMPALLGATAEFIPSTSISKYGNDVIKLDELHGDSTELGYIYGGIKSQKPNVFWEEEDGLSDASSTLFRVWLVKNNDNSSDQFNEQSRSMMNPMVDWDYYEGTFKIDFQLPVKSTVYFTIRDKAGKTIVKETFEPSSKGAQSVTYKIPGWNNKTGGRYYLSMVSDFESLTQQILFIP